MARRFKKQKAGYQTAKRRKKRPGDGSGSAVGTMSGMRGAFRKVTAAGAKSREQKSLGMRVLDLVLWIALIGVGFYFVRSRCV